MRPQPIGASRFPAGVAACFAAAMISAGAIAAGAAPELVLTEGASVTAHTRSGVISVLAGSNFARSYRWNDCELRSNMAARRSRWMGKRGIYDPAPGFGAFSPAGCAGISRTVVEEAQVHFQSDDAAAAWLARYATIYRNGTTWTRDGLVVSWAVVPSRRQLSANVLQVCVRGHKPAHLPDAPDGRIEATHAAGPARARHECAVVAPSVYEETQRAWAAHWK